MGVTTSADCTDRWIQRSGRGKNHAIAETLRSNTRSCPLLIGTIDVKSLSWVSVGIECILDIQRQMKSTCSYEEG